MGISPEIFIRLTRFQNAIRGVRQSGGMANLTLPPGRGYFGRPHFVKGNRSLNGLAPGRLLLRFAPQTSDVVLMNKAGV